jgi:malonyl-CoA decarboxylase
MAVALPAAVVGSNGNRASLPPGALEGGLAAGNGQPAANEAVLASYPSLSPAQRAALFESWLSEFESARPQLFDRLLSERGGMPVLVRVRQDLLQELRDKPSWSGVEADLTQVLKSAFSGSTLEFRRIEPTASTSLLEKLVKYEAVHEIRNWRELQRRLEGDRRCYAFFHPEWPDEPLIFAEVALTRGLGDNIQRVLDPDSPVLRAESSNCALFYSITNCQPGLRGFAFGNALIVRVIETLRAELPQLHTFATLSPIPGFRSWLSALASCANRPEGIAEIVAELDRPGWLGDHRATGQLKARLMPLCAYYLLHAKHGAEPADSVARFHLANGARLRRVNWLSDVSQPGLARAAGLTANYLYSLPALQRMRNAYARTQRVSATRQLRCLSRRAGLTIF